MDILDSDKALLKDIKGNVAERDIVQFVEFEKCNRDPFKLRSEVLKEVPNQVVRYFQLRGIAPNQGR
jgi:hypothetical protein